MVELQLNIPEQFFREEYLCGYKIDRKMKELWAVELDLLSELQRVCEKHKIRYFADAGTLLGAVRHGGYIPWDDDIDMMMRDAYQKLCEVAEQEFKHPYFFQTEYTDKGSLRGHAQLRNSETTGILSTTRFQYDFNQGIFIDIFPLDNAPDDENELQQILDNTTKYIKKARENAVMTSRYKPDKKQKNYSIQEFKHKLLSGKFGDIIGYNKYYDLYEQECQKYNQIQTQRVAKYFSTFKRKKLQVWDRSWFDHAVLFPFEFMEMPLPCGYEGILDKFFGTWKTPIYRQSGHRGIIFDTSKSYKQYFSEHTGSFQ